MDMMELMRNLPQMMGRFKEMQAQLAALRATGSSGGGMVTVTYNGQGELLDIQIEKSVIDPEDNEMLQDLIIAASADALRNLNTERQKQLAAVTGGLDLSAMGIDLTSLFGG